MSYRIMDIIVGHDDLILKGVKVAWNAVGSVTRCVRKRVWRQNYWLLDVFNVHTSQSVAIVFLGGFCIGYRNTKFASKVTANCAKNNVIEQLISD